MDKTKINLDKVVDTFNKISKLNLCNTKGENNPRVNERQFLYGDILDYLRDYHNDLNIAERDMVAKLVIGDYIIRKTAMSHKKTLYNKKNEFVNS